jgi:hypothetical protein
MSSAFHIDVQESYGYAHIQRIEDVNCIPLFSWKEKTSWYFDFKR